ncbi:hypothetical protein D3C76_1170930 [compost metagenome]
MRATLTKQFLEHVAGKITTAQRTGRAAVEDRLAGQSSNFFQKARPVLEGNETKEKILEWLILQPCAEFGLEIAETGILSQRMQRIRGHIHDTTVVVIVMNADRSEEHDAMKQYLVSLDLLEAQGIFSQLYRLLPRYHRLEHLIHIRGDMTFHIGDVCFNGKIVFFIGDTVRLELVGGGVR